MSDSKNTPLPANGYYILVTGANSGVGLALACRLVEEFLQTRPQTETLVLLTTTRDKRKGDATVQTLNNHLQEVCRKWEKTVPGISPVLQRRVIFKPEIVDLCSLISVQKLSKMLHETLPKLDVVICNAGIGGWRGLNWPMAVWTVLTGIKNATTWPVFKLARVGAVTKPQIPTTGRDVEVKEPPLGEVFCANFFGHYLLSHYLAPLLARHDDPTKMRGRLVWTTSLNAYAHTFDLNDIQGLTSKAPYETSKRLTDLMGLTYRLPSTVKQVDEFLSRPKPAQKPRIYLAHPGISATSIVPLPLILEYAMFLAFLLARCFGSNWHPVTAWKGAVSMTWIALAKQSTLDTMEEREGLGNWGSATDWWGQERVDRTEVDWYGYGGKDNESKKMRGRNPYAKDATRESRREFEQLGEKCWIEIERLRIEWEKRLDDAGVGIKFD